MANFLAGMGLAAMGIILFQLSRMFNPYPSLDKAGTPWGYWAVRIISFLLFASGLLILAVGFVQGAV